MKKKYKIILFAVLFLVVVQVSNLVIFLILKRFGILESQKWLSIIIHLPILTMLIGSVLVLKVYEINLNFELKSLSYTKISVLLFVFICCFVFSFLYEMLLNIGSGKLFFIKLIMPKLSWSKFSYFLIVLIIGPVVEEVLYRRIIFVKLKKHYSLLVSVLISSILFSVFHMDINNLVPAFIAGIFFAYVYHITKSLTVVIVFHSLDNLMINFATTTKVNFEPIVFVLYLTMFMMAFVGLIFGFKKLQKLYNVKNELE